jgi:hypothetical protein
MTVHTSVKLNAHADAFDEQAHNPASMNDPRWLRRWAIKLRRLAEQKELALAHKERPRR